MLDPRVQQLARNLIHYSTNLQAGEKILIQMNNDTLPLTKALIEEVYKVGAMPFLELVNTQLQRSVLKGASVEQLQLSASWETDRMSKMDAFIALRANDNVSELSDVPTNQMQLYKTHLGRPVQNIRIPKTKWCVLKYPNSAMAQQANMSTEAFENYFFDVCNLDYSKMDSAMTPLCELMDRTDKVRIVGPGTDLTFSIKDIPTIKCCGEKNIPDGEIFTAPVKDSINGHLSYNTQSLQQGFTFENIRFEFVDGKIVNATSNNTEKINQILDTDEGARYIGEFSFGVNPYIDKPMKDTLFDEKIKGSFHFTPGNSYDTAFNGNKSAIHWDLVCIQTPEYGGGEVWFDDVLIRKDGLFVLPELVGLNPENLINSSK